MFPNSEKNAIEKFSVKSNVREDAWYKYVILILLEGTLTPMWNQQAASDHTKWRAREIASKLNFRCAFL